MKAIIKPTAAPGLTLVDKPQPVPGPGDVLIEVKTTTVCGSDLHIESWDEWAASHVKPPMTIGHEMCGTVRELGPGATGVKPGDFVSVETHFVCGRCKPCRTGNAHVCKDLKILGVDVDGSFAQFVTVPASSCWINDPGLKPEWASLQEPFGNAVDTVFAEEITGKTVLLTGCGPIGLMGVAIAKAGGAQWVAAMDTNPARLTLAKQMGADFVYNPKDTDVHAALLEKTRGEGVEVLLEFSGAAAALHTGLESLMTAGRVSMLGLYGKDVSLNFNRDLIMRAVRIYGITGRHIFATWYKTRALLESGRINLDPLVSLRRPLTEYEPAFAAFRAGEAIKVALFPNGMPTA